jgi:hypothetical protein
MELPEPFLPGWYSTKQIQDMLTLKRQMVAYVAQREGWGFKKLGTGKLYKAEDVYKYMVTVGKDQEFTNFPKQ